MGGRGPLSVEFLPDSKRQEARGLHFDSLKRGWLGMEFFSLSRVKVWDIYWAIITHCEDQSSLYE